MGDLNITREHIAVGAFLFVWGLAFVIDEVLYERRRRGTVAAMSDTENTEATDPAEQGDVNVNVTQEAAEQPAEGESESDTSSEG